MLIVEFQALAVPVPVVYARLTAGSKTVKEAKGSLTSDTLPVLQSQTSNPSPFVVHGCPTKMSNLEFVMDIEPTPTPTSVSHIHE